ncbi:MAG TPA: hypothetical protein VKV23_06990 [Acidimicrobiales bacterium]|nr:hypothetical protein [Acidimicrobiales bacterium]
MHAVPAAQLDGVPAAGSAPEGEAGGPGTTARPSPRAGVATALVVAGITAFVVAELRPDLLFGPNLDVGGDNAAHVVAVYYFLHHLLPSGHLSGWDPQWDGGFPLYVFYFPLPAVLVGLLTVAFPYAVAFKLVTVLGSVTLPGAAYAFGRLAGLERPVPALMSVAMVPYLFNTSYTIDGGNIASTMAGEFSFSLALSFALVFLGLFQRALRTGRGRWLAALAFAATVLCHLVPALFAAALAVVLAAAAWRARAAAVLVSTGAVGGLLVAFWLLPFGVYLREGYSSSMNFVRVGDFFGTLFPRTGMLALVALALVGAVCAALRRERVVLALVLGALGAAGAFELLPSGTVYNGRWLPFWFLTCALVAAYGAAELARAALTALRAAPAHSTATPVVLGASVVLLVASWLGALPFADWPVGERNFTAGWVAWNYTGYQSKPGWHELSNLVAMLRAVARRYGCGLLDYEYSPNLTNYYGSTLAPMSLPMWTNGCIDTTEGLYYESSTTTDFHFLDQSELSLGSSDPVVGLPYQPTNVADGVRHLQLMGVRYFLANSPSVEAAAAADPVLRAVGSTPAGPLAVDVPPGSPTPPAGRWIVYRIAGSRLVVPLRYDPVVEPPMSNATWLSLAIRWYQSEADWPVVLARQGAPSWPRAGRTSLVAPGAARRVAPTAVSHVRRGTDELSFDVSRLGEPVLVRVPYFPNWQARGADGPYPVTPNLMVVVPRAHHVLLTYGTTGIDWVARGASALGIAGLALLWRADAAGPRRRRRRPAGDGHEPA